MSPIVFAAELDPDQFPVMFRRTIGIVGWPVWKRRIDALESETKSNPLWRDFLIERYGLEMALGAVHRHERATGKLRWPPRTAEEYRLCSFFATADQIHARLSPAGQKKLAGAFRSALEKEFGLGPLAFEMKIAAHLVARGFSLELHDLEGDGGYDFLAVRDSVEIEVECKHISADIGRQIPRRSLYDLGGILHSITKRAVDGSNGGRLIEITLPDRLTGNKEDQKNITDRIDAHLSGQATAIDNAVCGISEKPFALDDSPFSRGHGRLLTLDAIRGYLKQDFGIENENVLANWRPGHAAVVLSFKSARPDMIVRRILKNLKDDAKKQFSGNRPAFLCVHFADLTQEQLLNLAEVERKGSKTGLQLMANILLHKRPHLHTIAMMADGAVQKSESCSNDRIQTSFREIGPSYVYRSLGHSLAGNPTLDQVFV